MPKLNWKLIGIVAGAVIGVLVLAVVFFFVFFPKDLAAREAERRIEEATQRDLVLGGEIELTFFQALGFSVENASLSNPEGFDEPARRGGAEEAETPFIAADRIVFAVALMPLLSGDIQVKHLVFEGAELRLRAKADGTTNWTFPTEEEQETTLEDLQLDNVQLIDSLITFQGAEGEPLSFEDVDARLTLASLDEPANLEAALDYRGERLNIESAVAQPRAIIEQGTSPLTATVRSSLLEASYDGTFNSAAGALAGSVQAEGSSLRRLLAWLGTPMEGDRGFGPFSVASQMTSEGNTIALTEAVLRLDALEARGALNLITQESGRLNVTGALSAANLDLNAYLPEPAQGGEGVEVSSGWDTAPIDLTGLRALDANLNLTLGRLIFQRMNFTDVALGLRVANGALDARLSRIALYDGSGSARLIADGSGAVPRVAVELNVQDIQAEPLLRDAIGFDRITGRGRIAASLVGVGRSQDAIMRSLSGNASFNFNDGQWKGVNLAQMARTLQSFASGQAATSEGGATDFAELSATFAVADGAMATDNLRMLNPYVRLDGRGLINVGAQTIDMRIAPRAVNSIEGQGGNATVGGLGIPFRVVGPWSRVQFRPALEDIVQNQMRDILSRQGTDNPLGRLGDTLFGRMPAAPAAPAEGATETPAEGEPATPAQPAPQQERPRNPLEDIFRRATQGEEKQPDPPPGN